MKIKNQVKKLQAIFLLIFLPLTFVYGNNIDQIEMSLVLVSPNTGNHVYEGCGDPYLIINRNGLNMGQELNFSIVLTGTAQQELDFAMEVEELFFITFSPDEDQLIIPLNIVNDGISEPLESIIISLQPFCSGCQSTELVIYINDPLEALAVEPMDTIWICPTDTLTIVPEIFNDYVNLDYQWSDGSTQPIYTDPTPGSGIVTLFLSDDCGAEVEVDYFVETLVVQAYMDLATEVACGSLDDAELPVFFTGPGPYDLLFSFNGVLQDTIKNISESPVYLPILGVGDYELHAVSGDACLGIASGSRKLILNPFSIEMDSTVVTCYGGSDGSASLQINEGTAPYSIIWDNGLSDTIITGLESGYYGVSLTDFLGCVFEDSIYVSQNPPIAFATSIIQQPNCIDSSGGVISIPFECETYIYEWNIITEDPMYLDSLETGQYIVTATNSLGCVLNDTINLNGDYASPVINIEGIDTLNCADNFGDLEVVGLNNGIHDFLWESSDGLITGNPYSNSIMVGVGGTYQVYVQNQLNGCQDSLDIEIFEDFVYPTVATAVFDVIDCYNGGVTVYGEGSSTGGDYQYVWSSFDGNIEGPLDALNTEVTIGGLYTLSVINQNNGCISSSDLIVEDIIDNPEIFVDVDGALTCVDSIVQINTIGSEVGSEFVYTWTSDNGLEFPDSNLYTIEVGIAGSYNLEIANLSNGCVSTASVDVLLDNQVPELGLDYAEFFSCINDSIIIETSYAGNTADLIYNWTSPDSVLTLPDQSQLIVYTPGYINLNIQNVLNGCVNDYEFNLYENYNTPELEIEEQDEFLNCDVGILELNALNSASGLFSYEWIGLDGQVLEDGQGTLNPTINQPGLYMLEATDLISGCTDMDSIEVFGDTESPDVSVSTPDLLTCLVESTILNVDTSGYSNLELSWLAGPGASFNVIDAITIEATSVGEYILQVENTVNECVSEYTIEVENDTIAPEIVLNSDFLMGCIEDYVIIDASNSISGSAIEIIWDSNPDLVVDSSDSLIASAYEIGEYALTIVDQNNGCSSSTIFEIEADDNIPLASVLPIPQLNCTDTIVTVGVEPTTGYQYQWSTSNGTITGSNDSPSLMVSSAGIYDLLLTDSNNGCQNTIAVFVETDTVVPIVEVLPYEKLDCGQTELALTLEVSGTDPLAFYWTGPSNGIITGVNQSSVMVQEPGAYLATVTNTQNNCIWEQDLPVLEDVDYPVISIIGMDTLDCYSPSTELIVQTDNNMLYEVEWSIAGGQEIIGAVDELNLPVSSPAVYQVSVSNPINECVSTASLEVFGNLEAPLIDEITGLDINCNQDKVWLEINSLSTIDYEYVWSTLNGNIISPVNNSSILVDAAGLYELMAVNADNGCSSILSKEVLENTQVPELVIEDSYILNCYQPVLNLVVPLEADRFSVLWFNESASVIGSDSTMQFETSGIYDVELTDTSNGCQSTSNFEVVNHNFISMQIETIQPICSDPNGVLEIVDVQGSVEPFVYSLNGVESNNNSRIFEFLDAGDYRIEVEDVYGCKISQDANIKELIELDLGIERTSLIEEGNTYQVSVDLNFDPTTINSISWTPAIEISCTDCLEPVLSPSEQRVYKVEVFTDEGCAVEHELQLFVRDDRSVYAPNTFTPNGDGNNDYFMIYATDDYLEIKAFRVFDRWGELVYINDSAILNQTSDGWDGTFRNIELQSAVYIWYAELLDDKGNIELLKGDIFLHR
jgi:gliding motility-associated-like protein